MERLRIGVMGCASIARRLMIPAIKEMGDYWNLVAIASRSMEKAEAFAKDFCCEPIIGYDELIARRDIDAIYMPLPTGLHQEWIMKTLEKGKHIYAEKSIAMSGLEARQMVDKARSYKLALMEGYMFQYHRQHNQTKRLISQGEIGIPRLIRASFGFPPFVDPNNFRYNNNVGGGALKDAAGYVLRCVNFLFGNIFDVRASNVYYNSEGTSIFGSAFLTAGNELSAEISFGFDNYYQCNYEIWGSKGKLTCLRAFTPKPNEETRIILEKESGKETFVIPPDNHFICAMKEFYQICKDVEKREKHYGGIIYQAEGLDMIENLNKQGASDEKYSINRS